MAESVPTPGDQHISVHPLYTAQQLAEGDTWYVVDATWWEKFCVFTRQADGDKLVDPGPIDNSALEEPERPSTLKLGLVSLGPEGDCACASSPHP